MKSILNLSKIGESNPFSFDNYTHKQTATGLKFRTYRGLRMYLITGAFDSGWLNAVTEGDFLALQQKQAAFVYCKDLKDILKDALLRDIATRPMVGLIANRKTKVVTNSQVPAEIEWAGIVADVVSKL